MTQPIHLIAEIFAVEVPERAHGFDINKYSNGSELNYWLIVGSKETLIVTDLPAGNWQLICTTKECTEEQAKGIAGMQHHNFKEWWINFGKRDSYFTRATDSLRSLLTSKGLDIERNYILIKKLQ